MTEIDHEIRNAISAEGFCPIAIRQPSEHDYYVRANQKFEIGSWPESVDKKPYGPRIIVRRKTTQTTNIAIGLSSLSGVGTIVEISADVWSHAHIKIASEKAEELIGGECCFFMTGNGKSNSEAMTSSESFYCGKTLAVRDAGEGRYRIEFELAEHTVYAKDIGAFEGLLRGQHHVYY
jgi:hypothetical protein